MMDINVDLLKWFIDFLIKKTSGGRVKNENIFNKELADDLHKPIISKINKTKVHSPFIEYVKYVLVIPLKDKKGITITNAFQKILDESNHKPNKIWIEESSEFSNRSMKSWLEKKRYRNVFNL